MELNDVVRAVRGQRRLLAGGIALGLLLAAVVSWLMPTTYASTTQLFVTTAGNPANPSDPYNSDLFSQQRVVSYVQIVTGKELAQTVIDQLGLRMTAEELTAEITATPLPDTVVLQVTVDDRSARQAQAIATAVGRAFTDSVTALETPEGSTTSNVRVTTIQPADFNADPVSPLIVRNLVLGAALGLVLGFGLALLRTRMDRTVHRNADVQDRAHADPVGWIPEDRRLHRQHVAESSHSPVAEAFRALRLSVQHVNTGGSPEVLVVAGALPGEGTSTVAVNLAVSLVRAGRRVILVDGNLRRPRVPRYLGLAEDGPGLTDVLSGTVELRQAVQSWRDARLSVLGAGPMPADPDEVLSSPRMRSLLTMLRDTHDVVIVDAPPLLSVADAATLATLADGCLLVTRFGKTRREQLADAAGTLERVRARLLGVVLTHVPRGSGAAPTGGRLYAADPDRRAAVPSGPRPVQNRPDVPPTAVPSTQQGQAVT